MTSKPVCWLAIAIGCMLFTACGGGSSDSNNPGNTSTGDISYSIQITNSPAETSVRVGQMAQASMSWQFTTTENSVSTPYLIRSRNAEVAISGGTGSTLPSVVVTNDLSYECKTIGTVEIQLIVIVGNGSSSVTWLINCTGQRITVDPIDSSFGSIGEEIHTSFIWSYQSIGEDPQELEYTVTSSDESLNIHPFSGSSFPDMEIHIDLTYMCDRPDKVNVRTTVAVGTASETLVWEIVCTRESVVIEKPPEAATVSIGEDGTAEITWQFRSTGEDPREFSYSVTALEEGIAITDGTGSSLPDARITQTLSYPCEIAGRNDFSIAISVGSAYETIDWSVECTQESVFIELQPAYVSFSVGELARSEFKWQATTTSEQPRSFDFAIGSENPALLIGTAEGQITPGEVITTNIEFRCVEAGQLSLVISIEVGSENYTLAWAFECTKESIEFAVDPLPMIVVPIGEVASTELIWTLASTAVDGRVFAYSITADQPNTQIRNTTGITSPGATVTNEITYTCDVERRVDLVLRLQVGMNQADISWRVVCAQDAISIVSSPASLRVPVGATATSSISWTFESTYPDRQVSYTVESQSSGVRIEPAQGIVSTGNVVQSTLRFRCASPRSVAITVQIQAGGASHNLTWEVDCLHEDVTRFVSTFYQGPRIATVEFESNQGLWSYALVPESGVPETLRFRTNRQVFMAVRAEHDENPALSMSVWFVDGERRYTVDQVGETETLVNPIQSRSRYTSKFLFGIPAAVFSSHGEIQVLFDPETRYPENQEHDYAIGFALDARNTIRLPPINLTFVPIRTRDGVPNLSSVERYTRPVYELMPVGEITVEIASELNASDLSWSQDTGREILDRLYEIYHTRGDRHTVFHGVVKQPQDQRVSLCGIAFIGINVGITGEVTPECSVNTIAHEIGHNFNLQHAPACGAESENPDPAFPYIAGNIGHESGWLMKQLRFIDGGERGRSSNRDYRYYDVMSYCLETFTSRFSYGRALEYVSHKYGVQAARPVEDVLPQEFGRVRDGSVVVIGSASKTRTWQIRNVVLSDQSPHQFYPEASSDYLVQLIHVASGTVLHQEATRPIIVAHSDDGEASWGVRIPYIDSTDLQLIVLDRLNNVVLDHDLTATLNQLERESN